ncbi:glucose-1-phosphate adenylyltransferase [Cohnella lubricantis]|uniref:Glucose-1-phosphate adenylyltransferase n=1 Tax=Cohnella lubricantis TaxID=2163172 RepID=A0A841T8V2_9BACL|nr:glucose-1-phosphate adenylyltransferase [Cohnella lubricantis]MBB6676445.1 glucose-1-phosphate adenylyltransferase [Cohnella lubricantis]MBP2117548.1 glucose-1-phosphate adenylyltransferase [Cohnella lubricantis]
MRRNECIAMLLAGGEGRRLGVLTKDVAKPAVHFGGKYRIIDFTLSNCANSGIETVGVLTQYQPLELNQYLGIGSPWGLDRREGGMHVLPPYVRQRGGDWYKGTANAICQNIGFIERYSPDYVLIISGDHIYKMDYGLMLQSHKRNRADATLAVIPVPWADASRFGILSVDEEGRVTEFAEKPKRPESNLASMGVYMFTWQALRQALIEDEADPQSEGDFGKNVIPKLLREQARLFAYRFEGYWKDVGTIESLWEANMDLLAAEPALNLNDRKWRIFSVNPNRPAQFMAPGASVRSSLINEGCVIEGAVNRSVLFHGVKAEAGSLIEDSVIMPGAVIGRGAAVIRAIVGEGAVVGEGCVVGSADSKQIDVVGSGDVVRTRPSLPDAAMLEVEPL